MRDPQLEKIAATYYDPSLPYHNFGHIQAALAAGETILTHCRIRHQSLDEAAVYYGILFHDAGYQEDHRAKGFTCKEDYSAKIAEGILLERNVPAATRELACDAIRATRKGYEGKTTAEAQAVRAADLAQLAAAYPIFKGNTVKLWNEQERLGGKKMPWKEWREKAVRDVESFLEMRFFVEPGVKDTEIEPFLRQARANLAALAKDDAA